MISVATLTYRRESILEEAVQSFLLQNCPDCEMVILNDHANVEYRSSYDNVRVINSNHRFPSIGQKLKYCFSNCKHNYIYRLDDDDLLCEGAIENLKEAITNNPGYDIYRSNRTHYFQNNNYKGLSDSINNGNCYTKDYVATIEDWNRSCDEDIHITYNHNAKIYNSPKQTMIYRWGMETYHISGIGAGKSHDEYFDIADSAGSKTSGDYKLKPHFKQDYYRMIKEQQ